MARILYGVAGEGSGHSSRAKEIINYLQNKRHIVKIVSYDRGYINLKNSFDTEEIDGLRFSYKNNEVQSFQTILKNTISAHKGVKTINKVINIAEKFKPQIIFSDFEPSSCIVANIKNLPLISIDNQHRITNTKIEYPKKYEKDAIVAKAVTNLMIFNSKACLVTDFTKPKIINKKTFVFPPILRQEILEAKTKEENYILVYVTSEFDELANLLKTINNKFIVYGLDKNKTEKNITFKKASQKRFLKDLANCQGIIANAGFTLITEALYLRKPYLAIPVKGQFEQVLNAYYLDKLEYGKYYDKLDREKIEAFLFNLDLYKNSLKKYKKHNNSEIFKKIDEVIKKYAIKNI